MRRGDAETEGDRVDGLRQARRGADYCELRYEEVVRLEPDRLLALYAELGQTAADRVVCRAMEDMAVRLSDIQGFATGADWDGLIRSARLLGKVAIQVGMTTLARVAQDVCACTEARDASALGATLSRLVRIGDRSLTAVWDMQDMSV